MTDTVTQADREADVVEDCTACERLGVDCGEHVPSWEQLAIYWRTRALQAQSAEPSDEEVEREAKVDRLKAALEPFAAMGRVMETRARMTLGITPKDSEIVCESSGEAGLGILTMGHFRDAAALLPDAPGWGGMYKPLSREPLSTNGGAAGSVRADEEFCAAVWEALKGDHNDLRRQQIILAAHRASLAASTAQVEYDT